MPDSLALVEQIGRKKLSREEVDFLREVVLDEFLKSGLTEDSLPNSRGLRLELLIDLIGRLGEDA